MADKLGDPSDISIYNEAKKTAMLQTVSGSNKRLRKASRTNAPPDAGIGQDLGESEPDSVLTQWSVLSGGVYKATSRTIKKIPPGVYEIDVIQGQIYFARHKMTTDKLLRLPDLFSDTIIQEIQDFWSMKDTFAQFGFTHKRGFLLWGSPGSGKSSLIILAANDLVEKGGTVILGNSTSPSALTSALGELREVEPDRPVVVVLEDIDAYVDKHDESAVLALMDGEMAIGNVCYIATTNYPERLDDRFTDRPSRFDRVVEIGMPSEAARYMYFKSRNLPLEDKVIRHWAAKTDGFSLAHLKEIIVSCMCYGLTLEAVIRRLEAMRVKPSSKGSSRQVGFGTSHAKKKTRGWEDREG